MGYLEGLFGVSGKTALVTGGGTGIGRMVATALAEGGARVFICSRKLDVVEKTANEINTNLMANNPKAAGSVEAFVGDVGTEEGVVALADAIREQSPNLDILVNNAGITWGEPLGSFPHFAWKRILDVNVTGLFHLTQTLLPELKESGRLEDPARVINLGSVMGSTPIGDGAYSYSASKAAVHHLTRILAKELAKEHITFNGFAPGPFQSNMTAFATDTDEKAAFVGKGVPLGRIGHPDDIAAATLFLCGKGGSYVTGEVIPLDGGIHVATGSNLFG
ncbi:Rhamnolipids biosynthesis 3-oxoacyl-[acyl-carrier-protein] reductase [Pseudovibrio axinellae]|uniref:Rhamnolipids biosynthesis 3-oxoacyl-[acyl-carrier-protein] reductase n=1 Tax=Pseudovibrio axinellae TaxID=989403 RepID=A0A165XZ07_9HYPH|nr:SDR family oxidoreductase [Pseudovibrio axinellae]KZL18258.1 Rhamnolipids biosynthesis 3-oxoacyl-[acyl-carrier-protein] reductase [Pseudovibrio axinellae]SER72331.1 NAD(P)-dependent dehydrogenase, short-chain alcohol dehydrogenase family [Pseudovibrio axinellae]